MTRAIWRMDAHCLIHILDQRSAPAAHKDAQRFALMLDKVFSDWLPLTHKIYHELRGT
jgi:thymidylate synthase ThyX